MTTSEDNSAPTASTDPKPETAPAPASSEDASSPIEATAAEVSPNAAAPIVDAPEIEPLHAADQSAAGETIVADDSLFTRARRHAPLAAGIALALAFGAIAGAATTAQFLREEGPPAAFVAADANRLMLDGIARLERDFVALKADVGAAQRGTGAQYARLAERIERAEKAQSEPSAKIAKIAESLDRVERRLPVQAAARSDITGSVAAKTEPKSEPKTEPKSEPKEAAKPPLAEGWVLLDVYAGRAVVENRAGRVFEVAPGSNLPGLGRVDGIKREDGKYLVVTRNGVIAGSYERGRPGYFRD